MHIRAIALLAVAALPAGVASAQTSVSGTKNGLTWTASNKIVGTKSTATVSGGGNPVYLGLASQYRGVVGLLMHEAGGDFVCSGSLSADRGSIITAGHCVSDGTSITAQSVTAFFYNPATPDPLETPIYNIGAPNVTTVDISSILVNPLYTGEVIDDHDIAVLRLGSAAPAFATAYDLYTGDLTGLDYNVAGYGRRSDVGGALGVDLGTGRLRQGDNRYDFRFGDPDFFGFFAGGPSGFFGTAENDYTYIADFDSGLAANDSSCILASVFGAGGPQYCNLGRGLTEVSTAGGDSGGPQFVNGKLASITSFGLSFGKSFGDIDNDLNDSFGEFNGFVPISRNLAFVTRSLGVPEPATWGMMIIGFAMVGGTLRRQKRRVTVRYA